MDTVIGDGAGLEPGPVTRLCGFWPGSGLGLFLPLLVEFRNLILVDKAVAVARYAITIAFLR
jgi:hypothetical protein